MGDRIQDTITLSLSETVDIKVDTARIYVRVSKQIGKDSNVQNEILGVLNDILKGEWSISNVSESVNLGTTVVVASGSARFKQDMLVGIQTVIDSLKKQGQEVILTQIDRSPQHSKRVEAEREAKKKVYERAKAEAELANDTLGPFEESPWRVGSVLFHSGNNDRMSISNNVSYAAASNFRAAEAAELTTDAKVFANATVEIVRTLK